MDSLENNWYGLWGAGQHLHKLQISKDISFFDAFLNYK